MAFTELNQLSVPLVTLGMGEFGYQISGPKKTSKDNYLAPVYIRNYNTNNYSNVNNMMSADINYRFYLYFAAPSTNPDPNTGRRSRTTVVYTESMHQSAYAWAKKLADLINSKQVINDAGQINPQYQGTNLVQPLEVLGQNKSIAVQPTVFNIGDNSVTGFAMMVGDPEYVITFTIGAMVSLLYTIMSLDVISLKINAITQFLQVRNQTRLDALLVSNGIQSSVDYANGGNSLVGGSMSMGGSFGGGNTFGQNTSNNYSKRTNGFSNGFSGDRQSSNNNSFGGGNTFGQNNSSQQTSQNSGFTKPDMSNFGSSNNHFANIGGNSKNPSDNPFKTTQGEKDVTEFSENGTENIKKPTVNPTTFDNFTKDINNASEKHQPSSQPANSFANDSKDTLSVNESKPKPSQKKNSGSSKSLLADMKNAVDSGSVDKPVDEDLFNGVFDKKE